MVTVLGANSVVDSGYDVENSLRFNDGSSDNLSRTPGSSSAAGRRKFTISAWVKRGNLTAEMGIFSGGPDSNVNGFYTLMFDDADKLRVQYFEDAFYNIMPLRVFRDPSAWYHIVVSNDTTNGTSANRTKIYVNGVQQAVVNADGNTADQPNSNFDYNVNNDSVQQVGARRNGSAAIANYFDGYIAEFCMIDNQVLAADSFGEFDSDSGIWKPIDVSDLTFGTNGFYLEFKGAGTSANSSGLGADTSGNTHHFTVGNLTAVDQSTDTCTNNFATLAAGLYRSGATFSQGNLQYQAPSSNPVFGSLTTIGVNNGKWYLEVKYTAGSNHYLVLGIADEVFATLSDLGTATNTDLGKVGASLSQQAFAQNSTVAYVVNTGKIRNNNANGNYGSGGGDGQIINIALDRDNRKVYFGINGTYENSGDPAAGSNGFDLSSLVTGNTYFIGVTNDTGSSETIAEFNFGAPSFAISSSNADANDIGNFEYAVPSGFFALCTKNLAEFG